MTPRRIAFVGPTLPAHQRPRGPFAYRPPIRHGDLFDLALRPGDQVLIIDGVYQHFAPIRHKEILAQLARGVHVAGTASLGALRAAELADFGMQGLGQVYGQARAGRLSADADVAVLHTDDSAGARRLTEAMVCVRHALTELRDAGTLDAGQAARLEQAAARLHFTERSHTGLRHAAGPDRQAMNLLLDHLRHHGDIKTRDARHALDTLAARPVPPPAPGAASAAEVWTSSYGREWDFEHRPLKPGSTVGARLALACLQLFAPDFPERHRAYTLRLATTTAAAGTAGTAGAAGAAGTAGGAGVAGAAGSTGAAGAAAAAGAAKAAGAAGAAGTAGTAGGAAAATPAAAGATGGAGAPGATGTAGVAGAVGAAGALLSAAGFAPATRPYARLARATEATAHWTADERLLARTFRLPPGRLVYQDLPPEAVAGSTLDELEQRCLHLLLPPTAPPAPTSRRHALLQELWQTDCDHDYRLCALERGFRDTAEAARLAGAFDLALIARLLREPAATR
ncbi:TfuA-like protein [Streptomyces sp. NPDC001935]